jgi:hypothetical protein
LKSRLPVDNSEIAEYSGWLEFHGKTTKAAISLTMERFGVSRTTVTSARKQYLKLKRTESKS